MNINTVLKHFGSQSELARQLGVTPQAVQLWVKSQQIPRVRQYQIQVLTAGLIVVEPSGRVA